MTSNRSTYVLCASMEPLVAESADRGRDLVAGQHAACPGRANIRAVQGWGYLGHGSAATGELANVTDDGYAGGFLLEPSDPAVSYSFDVSPHGRRMVRA